MPRLVFISSHHLLRLLFEGGHYSRCHL